MAPTLLLPDENKNIPIDIIIRWFKARMSEYGGDATPSLDNRVAVIQAETGSGKSTVLPVYLFRLLRDPKTPRDVKYVGKNLICTQPKVLTALSLALDISSKPFYSDCVLGNTVGYLTGSLKNVPPSGIIYATSSVLGIQLTMNEDEAIMSLYKFIIIDEVHERSVYSDTMLYMLRNFYIRNQKNKNLPYLILTSATLNTDIYADYFNVDKVKNVIKVKGRTYPITNNFLSSPTSNYIQTMVETTIKIHEENLADPPDQCDILLFVPGNSEINEISKLLALQNNKYIADDNIPPMLVLGITREEIVNNSAEARMVLSTPKDLPLVGHKKPKRRVIISTSVAETGLTIDTLKYVMDMGYHRGSEKYSPSLLEGLITRPAPKSRVKQRAGRVGRLFAGIFYAMYTEETYNMLEEQQFSDIVSIGATSIILAIIAEQLKQKRLLGEIESFKTDDITMLEIPNFICLRTALAQASEMGLVKYDKLTEIGKIGAMLTKSPLETTRLIFSAYVWDVALLDIITISCLAGLDKNSFYDKKEVKKNSFPKAGQLPMGSKILMSSVPSFIVSKHGGSDIVLPPTEEEASYFRIKLLIADDFIEYLFIYENFKYQLEKYKTNILELITWCVEMGLNFNNLMEFSKTRDSLIEDVLAIGLNPFHMHEHKIINSSADNFMERLVNIKQCIYEAHRHKLIEYKDNGYYTLQGIRVLTPAIFSDALANKLRALNVKNSESFISWRPRWIISDKFDMKSRAEAGDTSKSTLYSVETNFVSILDGYINPDTTFNLPQYIE